MRLPLYTDTGEDQFCIEKYIMIAIMIKRRKRITHSIKLEVFAKTGGRCHICGRPLVFASLRGEKGRWNVDHIVPFKKGGKDQLENYLPICRFCNRLKWFLKGKRLRRLLQFGVIASRECRNGTDLGKQIKKIYLKKMRENKGRRKGNFPDSYYW